MTPKTHVSQPSCSAAALEAKVSGKDVPKATCWRRLPFQPVGPEKGKVVPNNTQWLSGKSL